MIKEKINNEWYYYFDNVLKQDVYYIKGFSYNENVFNNTITLIRNNQDKQNKVIHLTINFDRYGESVYTKSFSINKKENIKVIKEKSTNIVNELILKNIIELYY